MKRYIRSAIKPSSHPDYESYMDFNIGSRGFGAHYTARNDLLIKGYVMSYHPYDDADYTWAKIEGPRVTFIRDRKVLDKMSIPDFDPDYDTDFDSYLNTMFTDIGKEMLNFDKDVERRMVHN